MRAQKTFLEGPTRARLHPISAGRGHHPASDRSQHPKPSCQGKIKPQLHFLLGVEGELANVKGKGIIRNTSAVTTDTRDANDLPLTVNTGWPEQQPPSSFIPITSPCMSQGGNYYWTIRMKTSTKLQKKVYYPHSWKTNRLQKGTFNFRQFQIRIFIHLSVLQSNFMPWKKKTHSISNALGQHEEGSSELCTPLLHAAASERRADSPPWSPPLPVGSR